MEEITQLKSVLRSLVVSSPTEMDVRALLRDYKCMMGEQIPLHKFGYKEPLTFLKEKCSDCFLFTGPPSNPVLTLIVPETLKHIDEFVQKQKRSTISKYKSKRHSVPQSVIQTPSTNLIFESFVSKKTPQINNRTKPKSKPPDEVIHSKSAVNVTRETDQENYNKKTHEKVYTNENVLKENNGNTSETNSSNTALQNFLKKRIPVYDNLDNYYTSSGYNESTKDEVDSGIHTSSNCSSKGALFEQLKDEIREVISEHPDGVSCTDLIRLYRKRYTKELDFGRLGYTSIVSALYAMGDAVALSRPDATGDWVARHPAAPAPPPAPRARKLHAHAHADPPVDPDDALPGIQYDPDVFPEDCMQYAETLPLAPIADVHAGMLLEVMVGEVYSPSHLWLIRLGEEYHIAMEDMMDEMTEYYERGAGAGRVLSLGAARAGQVCACRYEGDWHRALVVRELDADTVKVRLVDYGTVEQTPWRQLRPLPRRWAALPAQALRGRLAGVAPRALHWPRPASHRLLRAVHCKHLVAHVAAVDTQENILEVFLVDTSGEQDLCIANDLIVSGHAEQRSYSSLQTSECHLFPRFEALETGATPNFGEIENYLRHGISLQYVEDYRLHVPADLPPPPPAASTPSPPETPPAPPSPPAAEPEPAAQSASSQGAAGIHLTLAECEMYRVLCATSPRAAHLFMVDAISRAVASSAMSLTSPASRAPPAPHAPHAPHAPPAPSISMLRPPPGFDAI